MIMTWRLPRKERPGFTKLVKTRPFDRSTPVFNRKIRSAESLSQKVPLVFCETPLFYSFPQFSRVFHRENPGKRWKTGFPVEKGYL